jgi:hypothetical protein
LFQQKYLESTKSVRVRRDDRLQINDLGINVAEAPFAPSFLVSKILTTDIAFVVWLEDADWRNLV